MSAMSLYIESTRLNECTSKAIRSCPEDRLMQSEGWWVADMLCCAAQAALNCMDSVAGFDFFGSTKESLWCRTSTENMYLWDWKAACSEDQEGRL